jgi:hypothetical protein
MNWALSIIWRRIERALPASSKRKREQTTPQAKVTHSKAVHSAW